MGIDRMVKRHMDPWDSAPVTAPMIFCIVVVALTLIYILYGCAHTLPEHSHSDDKPTEVNVNLPDAAKGDVEAVVERLASSDNWPLWIACMVILVGSVWWTWLSWTRREPARTTTS